MVTKYNFTATDNILYKTIKNRIYIDPDTKIEFKVTGLTKISGVTNIILEEVAKQGKFHVITSHELTKLQYTIK